MNDGILKSDLDDALNTQLKTITKVPKQKWNLPQTANQEIGWWVDVLFYLFRNLIKTVNLFTNVLDVPKLTTQIITTR